MSQAQQRLIAIGTARLELRRKGDDPGAVDGRHALWVLADLRQTEPDLPASQWYTAASEDEIALFVREWDAARRSSGDPLEPPEEALPGEGSQ